MEITVHSTEETKKLAQQVASQVKPGDIIALYGDLGSGKTTFTRFLVEFLGVPARVQSPTFIIHRVYEHDSLRINHFDLYRLTSLADVLDMGFRETLADENSVTIIEWPEVAEEVLNEYNSKLKKMYFTYISEDERLIKII